MVYKFLERKEHRYRKSRTFFKDRHLEYQFIDINGKGMSMRKFTSVAWANGGMDNTINWERKDKDMLALIKYIADEDKLGKNFENPQVIRMPVFRNSKKSH